MITHDYVFYLNKRMIKKIVMGFPTFSDKVLVCILILTEVQFLVL